jgi:serine/threonine protein kinase
LGAILYNMLSGKLPYDERTPLQTVLKVISPEMPPPLREIRPDVPVDLEHICTKCMRKQPAKRFESAEKLALALRRFRAGVRQPNRGTGVRRKASRTAVREGPCVVLTAAATGEKLRASANVTTVGRHSECGIVLLASDVSKKHCQIVIGQNHAAVEDLDSANGTFINGRPIKRARLKEGDRLRVADHEFVVRLEGFGTADEEPE